MGSVLEIGNQLSQNIKFHGYNDNSVQDGRPDQTYAIQGYPTKIIVSPEGKIAKIVTGEDPQFYTDLDNLLQ